MYLYTCRVPLLHVEHPIVHASHLVLHGVDVRLGIYILFFESLYLSQGYCRELLFNNGRRNSWRIPIRARRVEQRDRVGRLTIKVIQFFYKLIKRITSRRLSDLLVRLIVEKLINLKDLMFKSVFRSDIPKPEQHEIHEDHALPAAQ